MDANRSSSSQPQVVGTVRVTGSAGAVEEASVRLRSQSPRTDAAVDDLDLIEDKDPVLEAFAAIPAGMGWTAVLLIASGLDVISGITVVGMALHYGFKDVASSLGGAGVQVTVHTCSSLLLVVRSLGDLLPMPDRDENVSNVVSSECLLGARRKRDLSRERDLGRGIAVVMAVGSILTVAMAVMKMLRWESWYHDHQMQDEEIAHVTYGIAWYSVCAFTTQAFLRWAAARKLRTLFIWHCSIISCISVFAAGLLVAASSFEAAWWKAEPIAAAALACVMCGELYLITKVVWSGRDAEA
mmetsp:Transcript_22808/g.53276  ORF Transcript_22808/g.53276 Transcript_22808/m.53276 type:complete len:298 (+) Transcript_22808:203-1096(+)